MMPQGYDPTRADSIADALRRELEELRDRAEVAAQEYRDALADVSLELGAFLGDLVGQLHRQVAKGRQP